MQNQIQTRELIEEPAEEWRDIPGYAGLYEVSDQGRVLNLRKQKILCQITCRPDNIVYVFLRDEHGCISQRSVARLVLQAFRPGEKGKYSDWINKDRSDNRLVNLRWKPRKNSKLSDDDVRDIRTRWMTGESGAALGRAYRVSDAVISNIICGYSYKDVK